MSSLPEINDNGTGKKRVPQIRIAKQIYRKNLFKSIMRYLALTLISLCLVYLCFAATIVRFIPSSSAGIIPLKNITDIGGVVKENKIIVVNNTKQQGDSMFSHLQQSLTISNKVSVVKVISGPYGKLDWKNNTVSVNNKILNIKIPEVKNKDYLNNEYIVQCIKGACNKNSYFIVSMKNIYGEPLKDYSKGN